VRRHQLERIASTFDVLRRLQNSVAATIATTAASDAATRILITSTTSILLPVNSNQDDEDVVDRQNHLDREVDRDPGVSADSGPGLGDGRRGSTGAKLLTMKLIVRWLLLAAALLLVAYLYPGVSVTSFGAALIAAFVLGLLNTIVRPLLVLLTLPVTLLTLGLFLFVINALMFWAAAGLLDGFNVNGFAAALIGSLLYSLCGMVIDVAVERLFSRS
jgi:putative membrane protein